MVEGKPQLGCALRAGELNRIEIGLGREWGNLDGAPDTVMECFHAHALRRSAATHRLVVVEIEIDAGDDARRSEADRIPVFAPPAAPAGPALFRTERLRERTIHAVDRVSERGGRGQPVAV